MGSFVEAARREKLKELVRRGVAPFAYRFDRSTTALDAVPFHFGFQAARMSDSLDYLKRPRPWRRMFVRYLRARE